MKNFLIFSNKQKDTNFAVTESIRGVINAKGATCRVYDIYSEDDEIEIPEDIDCILVIGGDGTILKAASTLVGKNIPLLGVNLGTLGFLTDVKFSEIDQVIDDLLVDDYELEKRVMIKGEVYKDGCLISEHLALNDFVVRCRELSHLVGLRVEINGVLIDRYDADGLIVCTPTGSTGYNLSAGGPIINPTCKNFVFTPICPHSLTARSVVLAKNDELVIEVEQIRKTQKEEAVLIFDGQQAEVLNPGDKVRIYKAQEVTPFVKIRHLSFIKVLKEKLF